MITYVRTKPFPLCRYCGKLMDYWIPGQSDEHAAHPKCAGKHIANEAINVFKNNIRGNVDEKQD